MSLAIVDAREWQKMFDLRSGRKVQEDGPLIRMLSKVLERHPFPGNTIPESSTWVTDTALELLDRYEPQFVFLSYTRNYFASYFTPLSETERQEIIASIFREVERFVGESGFTPVILGTGDMIPFQSYIDLSRLDGFAMSTHWSARYAGLHEPSKNDLKKLNNILEIERVVSRDDFVRLFGTEPDESLGVPDYLLVAAEGHTFKTAGTNMRRSFRIPGRNFVIPISSPLGKVEKITGIRKMIEDGLDNKHIAMILVRRGRG